MRCNCVSETVGGEFIRCTQMVHDSNDKFCYYHQKIMTGLTTPAEREYTDPDRIVAVYVKGSTKPHLTFHMEGDIITSPKLDVVA